MPTKFVAAVHANSRTTRRMRCSIRTPSVVADESGKGFTIRYVLAGASGRHLIRFEIRASLGAGGAGAAGGRWEANVSIAGIG